MSPDDPLLSCGSNDADGYTVWYKFTPPSNGTLTVSTDGSDYDTVVGVWTGSPGDFMEVDCDDDDGEGRTSWLATEVSSGEDYFIEVASYYTDPGTAGQLSLTVDFDQSVDPPPTNDDFDNAIEEIADVINCAEILAAALFLSNQEIDEIQASGTQSTENADKPE